MRAAPYGGPPPRPEPPIVLAGMMPKMLALAAAETHGTHTYFTTTEQIAHTRQALGPQPWLCAELGAMLETDATKARRAARDYMRTYLAIDHYVQRLRAVGFGDTDFADGGSERLVDALIAWGDEERIRQRIDAYYQAGASHVVPPAAQPRRRHEPRPAGAGSARATLEDGPMQTQRAIVVDPEAAGRLAIHELQGPDPGRLGSPHPGVCHLAQPGRNAPAP